MKKLSILGSTGSIGVNTLNVIRKLDEDFTIKYLTANSNTELLIEQAIEFHPETVVIVNKEKAKTVQVALEKLGTDVMTGREGLLECAADPDVDILLNGLVGSSGMEPTFQAVKSGVDVALSNKESLVMAGDLINREKESTGATIFPVDSEHSAIWQCLSGESMDDVRKIILTGSGGPFRTRAADSFYEITPEEALNHPNWDMGNKITIDSATMMNKGLEIIETHWLFDMELDAIDIVVHPQSIIHSMVEFKDRSVKAQLGIPDMKIPIQYALTYPRHSNSEWESLDLAAIGSLSFEPPDLEKFPCIKLAYDALKTGGSTPAVLNVVNEYAVYRFLKDEIRFTDISKMIEKACEQHDWVESPDFESLSDLESWSIEFVNSY
ncbi:MAG: 1-deoxy-D-xylulose-5-phosphate reductoisomerase [Candidatus Marinimicrobia bacterium]|jgi:1-deoxy-D-xylulose-5-phosphate reductoisomerase|nr:1-deoxy-D-xylulose-5-phosphate reductoisomerase [Candidatus Neomarinimicrobiota bacterium]|tara:strand:+ start:421 stop:1563 length:1143 start_codon:yes stop_codon:yes gene_type:complete